MMGRVRPKPGTHEDNGCMNKNLAPAILSWSLIAAAASTGALAQSQEPLTNKDKTPSSSSECLLNTRH
jgi:hypothetical protein